ncbi:prepilin-type N-terminal cleavage/methylation domain-containing protein [Candidatus Saccharibacteria bacterium]|nr:prepilin-type N-terminal cleavage/methylation domain-containing protein [Candidatus Saccharibacteria bacterium]
MKKRSGFTLIELLVVITIIGLLASVGIASYTRAQQRGRDARRQSDFSSLRNALELYYADNGSYVASGSWTDVSTALSSLVPLYIKDLPSDPGGQGQTYKYIAYDSEQTYCLESYLEASDTTQSNCRRIDGSQINLQGGYNYGVGNP